MKIGILTFHHGHNYGGFLQCYSMQKYLESKGHDVYIINYINKRHKIKKIRSMFSLRRPHIIPVEFRKMMLFSKAHKKHYRLTDKARGFVDISKFNFDAVILGSDEIWNFDNMMFGFDPCYLGYGIKAGRVISYAASFGPRTLHDNPPKIVGKALLNLDAISVRDLNSRSIVKQLTGKNAAMAADPTFLVDLNDELVEPCVDGKYAIIYGVQLKDKILEGIHNYAKNHSLKLISLGYYFPDCDMNLLGITPFQFLGWIKNADIVFTGMFHGSIFSILFRKKFIFCMNEYRKNKVDYMFSRLNISQNVLSIENPELDLNVNLDYDSIFSEIKKYRNESEEYLLNALDS